MTKWLFDFQTWRQYDLSHAGGLKGVDSVVVENYDRSAINPLKIHFLKLLICIELPLEALGTPRLLAITQVKMKCLYKM